MLEPVGISPADEALFRTVLDHPRSSAVDLAARAARPAAETEAALGRLVEGGLVVRTAETPPRFVPTLPDLAIESLILRRQEELEQVRAAAHELAVRFRDTLTTRPSHVAEVVSGRDAVAHLVRQVRRAATHSVLVADRPPYAEVDRPALDEDEVRLLARGVECRRLYHRPILDVPAQVDHLQAHLAAGERARVLPEVPLKMLVVDRRRAVIPLEPDAPAYDASILVHAAPLVEALALLFEAQWERAVPIRVGSAGTDEAVPGQPGSQDQRLLTLLAAGLKDEAVARQLGLSARTVVRRVDRMMKELGADTRFQAGLQAVRRGWL